MAVSYVCDTRIDLLIGSTEAVVFHQHHPMLCVMGQRSSCGCFAVPVSTRWVILDLLCTHEC